MIVLEKVAKTYRTSKGNVNALNGINLHVGEGEFVAVSGPSGSGKTTLLMTIAGMLRPTSGAVSIDKNNLYTMSMRERAKFRAENIGFVFQMFHLVPYLNVTDNVLLAGGVVTSKDRKAEARYLIERFGLTGRNHHTPAELSAGEKQRTAVARALLNRPKIILADEPTGNLDPDNTASVLGYISDFHRNGGTVVLATHGRAAEQFADRTIHLQNGTVAELPSQTEPQEAR
jgi:ABC-type lipoprotein export system ATPase subunit